MPVFRGTPSLVFIIHRKWFNTGKHQWIRLLLSKKIFDINISSWVTLTLNDVIRIWPNDQNVYGYLLDTVCT